MYSKCGEGSDLEYDFDEESAICELIEAGIVFIGGKSGPFFRCGDESGAQVGLWVNCNDLWAWATADAEPLAIDDIEPLYVTMCNPARFSFQRWAALRYRRLPMPEIVLDMKSVGVWDDALGALERETAARQ